MNIHQIIDNTDATAVMQLAAKEYKVMLNMGIVGNRHSDREAMWRVCHKKRWLTVFEAHMLRQEAIKWVDYAIQNSYIEIPPMP